MYLLLLFIYYLLIGDNAMKMKCYRNGHASMEYRPAAGLWLIECRIGTELHDKVRCDDYRAALEYFRAFCAIAKTA
jgi:hypothetical protein